MTIHRLYADYTPAASSQHPTVSFELYPPRNPSRLSAIWGGVTKLVASHPDYVSVTYGAGGGGPDTRDMSVQVLNHVLDKHPGVPAVAHLTCLGSTEQEMSFIVRLLIRAGVRNFLALRGDPPAGEADYHPRPGTLDRAWQLVELIRGIAAEELPCPASGAACGAQAADDYVSIGVAAYPAGRGAARERDLAALAQKAACGADFAITQVFYDPQDYVSLVRELALTGVRIPIIPGILPLHDPRRLQVMERLAGISVPEDIAAIHRIADPAARSRAALGRTAEIMTSVLEAGAPGVHIYTFNRPRPTLDLVEYLRADGWLGPQAADRRITPAPPGAGVASAVNTELVGLALNRLSPAG